ncbi:hypothetical protein GCM10009613_42890 [Pseudonocardia kongjuensis]|uniref:Uncharacterized protein n=1 Tax=Pseudonocardia kongjuensis TaxID=102227 RepID=A0ABN1Y0I1_9PSEU
MTLLHRPYPAVLDDRGVPTWVVLLITALLAIAVGALLVLPFVGIG